MNVPVMNDTPSTMATSVDTILRLCSQRERSVTLRTGSEVPERLHAVDDLRGAGLEELADDVAVGQEEHPVGVGRRHRVVGDHHDGLAQLANCLSHEAQDLA